jgi:hypothetical protein
MARQEVLAVLLVVVEQEALPHVQMVAVVAVAGAVTGPMVLVLVILEHHLSMEVQVDTMIMRELQMADSEALVQLEITLVAAVVVIQVVVVAVYRLAVAVIRKLEVAVGRSQL